jgi:hypothetical protein
MTAAANPHLATYLNDHLAGAEAGLELVDALQKQDDAGLKQLAGDLHTALAADRDELSRIMNAAGIGSSPIRRAVGWLSEKAARLKLAVDDPADGGLRAFELLEALAIGIHGKRALWDALTTIAPTTPALRGADYPRLILRADEQRAAVELHRLRLAATTFART